ncbi:MAG: class I SAM-dependent methyltransferase [Bifidobacteriaceae bacterium]|nr:class I SAM-dependent methyltransferase [Bifidobacteriaceae bacterium]
MHCGSVRTCAEAFDLVSFVASLHHLPAGPALAKAARVLRPGGRLRVVGSAWSAWRATPAPSTGCWSVSKCQSSG